MANPTSGGQGKTEGVRRVPVLTLGRSSAATVLTRWRGQIRLTVIAKATFAFAPQAEMTQVDPDRMFAREIHHDDNPAKSIRAPGDLAPHIERAQAIFVGTAYSGGAPQKRVDVRFAIGAVHGVLMDKRLEITGDRRVTPRAEPAPFSRMPIVYERAYGGIGFPDNPLGPGIDTSAKVQPNITYAEASRAREPAGLGPISSLWPARKRLLKGITRKELDARLIELPDEFTFDYFQAVPRDQQVRALEGREWIVLEGVNERHPMLHMRIPWARAAAIVYGPGVPCRPFELTADTLYVDGDAERCSITYRASIPIAGDHVLDELAVAAGVETASHPFQWPERLVAEELRSIAAPPESSHRRGDFVTGTLSVADLGVTRTASSMPPPERVLPFVENAGGAPASKTAEAPIPGAPWAAGPAAHPAPLAGSPFESTVALDERPFALPEAPALPASSPAPPPGPAREPQVTWREPDAKPSPGPTTNAPSRPEIAPLSPAHKQSFYRKFDKG